MFENIIGNYDNIAKLEGLIDSKDISHSYLFIGPKGIGKSIIAKEFAKVLLKVDNLESSQDYKYITRMDGKKDIVIEQVRKEIIDDISIIPSSGDKKVYIIDSAEDLNTEAQNALLKTLEEPPEYVVIILVSSSLQNFLPTILSRVYRINFNKIDDNEIDKYIKEKYNINFDNNILKYIDGSLGLAISIIKDNLQENLNKVDELYVYLSKKDSINSLLKIKDIEFKDIRLLDYLEFLLYLNLKYNCVDIVEKTKQRLKFNGNYDIVITTMILKIIDNIN